MRCHICRCLGPGVVGGQAVDSCRGIGCIVCTSLPIHRLPSTPLFPEQRQMRHLVDFKVRPELVHATLLDLKTKGAPEMVKVNGVWEEGFQTPKKESGIRRSGSLMSDTTLEMASPVGEGAGAVTLGGAMMMA